MTVEALGEEIVKKLRFEGHSVFASRVVLWRVSHEDVDPLRHGGTLSAAASKMELSPEDVIADDTFSADHRVWVQLLGGGTGAWGAAAGCGTWGGALTNPVQPLSCATLPIPAAHRAHAPPLSCPLPSCSIPPFAGAPSAPAAFSAMDMAAIASTAASEGACVVQG
jgi:hypothetical protein